jgi:hypothetical protein
LNSASNFLLVLIVDLVFLVYLPLRVVSSFWGPLHAFEYQYKNNKLFDSEMNFAVYPTDIQNNLQIDKTVIGTEYMAGTYISIKDKEIKAAALVTTALFVYLPEIPVAAGAFCGSTNICSYSPR